MFISLFVTLYVKLDPGTHKGMNSVLGMKLDVTRRLNQVDLISENAAAGKHQV
jgi:hypothetical protein